MSLALRIQEPNVSWLLNMTFCGSFHVPTCLKPNTSENPKPRERDFIAPLPGLCDSDRTLFRYQISQGQDRYCFKDLIFSLLHPHHNSQAGGCGMDWQKTLSVDEAGENLGSCPGGQSTSPRTHSSSLVGSRGFSRKAEKTPPCPGWCTGDLWS